MVQFLREEWIILCVSSGDTSPPAGFTEKKMTINIVCVVASFCRSLYAAFFTRVKNRRDSQTDGAIARLVGVDRFGKGRARARGRAQARGS
ncbi:hypothetical protein N7453_006541 [Penicillium expansum]|nr:hypothetical protein N7453_006541 [Penicillium expansum]